MRSWWFLALFAVGCAPTTAIVDGRPTPRLDLDFVGQPFAVRVSAAHPRPGSPSGGLRDFGGHVSGNVCGIELTYDVQHLGDRTHLTGFLDDGDTQIDVRDVDAFTRVITGALSDKGGNVSLEVRKNHIRGVVGLRVFELARRGDQYLGWIKITQSVTASATINGAGELWALPPAAQAAVLPSLLTCYGDALEDHLGGAFVVGFGGRQTWEARHVSSLYHGVNDVTRTLMQSQSSGQQQLQGGP
jgi:hypothetical protein